jgi:ligand-binding sensor domain-containing protein
MLALIRRKWPRLAVVPIALLLLLAVTEPGVFADSESERVTHIGEYTIQNWQVEQGLPQISITAITQTPDGYLWLGTFNGLVRFDGVRFTVFHEGNTPALGNSAITGLQTDEQGALWIVTLAGGLVRMAAGLFTVAQKENAQLLLTGAETPDDSSHRLLLLDRDGRWRQIENNRLLPLDSPARLGPNDAPRFLFENSGRSWVAQPGHLNQSHKTTFPVLTDEGTNRIALTIHSAAASQAGGYWVATSNGLYRLRQGKLSARVAPLPSTVPEQLTMTDDGQGSLWAVCGLANGARGSSGWTRMVRGSNSVPGVGWRIIM